MLSELASISSQLSISLPFNIWYNVITMSTVLIHCAEKCIHRDLTYHHEIREKENIFSAWTVYKIQRLPFLFFKKQIRQLPPPWKILLCPKHGSVETVQNMYFTKYYLVTWHKFSQVKTQLQSSSINNQKWDEYLMILKKLQKYTNWDIFSLFETTRFGKKWLKGMNNIYNI